MPTDEHESIELTLDIISELVGAGASGANLPREVAASIYSELVAPLIERAEKAEGILRDQAARRGDAPELHEVIPPPSRGGQYAGMPKQECSCGTEWASSMSLYMHQAKALRAELQIFADLVPVIAGEVERVSAVAVATREEQQAAVAIISDLEGTIANLRATVAEKEAMNHRAAQSIIELKGELRTLKEGAS